MWAYLINGWGAHSTRILFFCAEISISGQLAILRQLIYISELWAIAISSSIRERNYQQKEKLELKKGKEKEIFYGKLETLDWS